MRSQNQVQKYFDYFENVEERKSFVKLSSLNPITHRTDLEIPRKVLILFTLLLVYLFFKSSIDDNSKMLFNSSELTISRCPSLMQTLKHIIFYRDRTEVYLWLIIAEKQSWVETNSALILAKGSALNTSLIWYYRLHSLWFHSLTSSPSNLIVSFCFLGLTSEGLTFTISDEWLFKISSDFLDSRFSILIVSRNWPFPAGFPCTKSRLKSFFFVGLFANFLISFFGFSIGIIVCFIIFGFKFSSFCKNAPVLIVLFGNTFGMLTNGFSINSSTTLFYLKKWFIIAVYY